jgi:NADH:ubiquinone oxidoreductase subunit 2 (subunit N)
MLIIVENKSGGSNHIDTFKGLASRHPWLSVFLALFMFSLAGFPPTAGFFAKFYLFAAAVNAGLVWLVIVAVLNSLISVFYYLRPVKAAFFDRIDSEDREPVVGYTLGVAIVITVAGTIILGLFPGYFLDLATSSVFMIM